MSGSPLPKIGGPFVEKSRNSERSKGIQNLASTELIITQSPNPPKKPKL